MAASSLTWQVEYARFMSYPPLDCIRSTHSILSVRNAFLRKRSNGGAWFKSSGTTAIVKLFATGSNNAVLIVSLQHNTLDKRLDPIWFAREFYRVFKEEHFISKLNFTWPQMSCVSQLPVRGSRAVFASYKDSAGQIQTFAMRFVNGSESQSFVNSLKESLKYVTTVGTSSVNTASQVQSQNGLNTANKVLYPSNEFENHVHPTDSRDPQAQTPLDGRVRFESREARLPNDHPGVCPNLPPSFTSTGQESQTVAEEANLQSHPAKFMTAPSFNAMLSKLESFISHMGGDMTLQLP